MTELVSHFQTGARGGYVVMPRKVTGWLHAVVLLRFKVAAAHAAEWSMKVFFWTQGLGCAVVRIKPRLESLFRQAPVV